MDVLGTTTDVWTPYLEEQAKKKAAETKDEPVAVEKKTEAVAEVIKPKVIYSCSSGSSYWQK